MTILTVVKDVCAAVGVMVPTSIFSGIQANRTMQEMLALANEMAQRIAYDAGRDWTKLLSAITLTGDGAIVSFDLPANFKRMPLTANVRRSTDPATPMRFISDYDEWIDRRLNNKTDGGAEWIITNGQMTIYPTLAVGVTAMFPYLDKNCVALASGGFGDTFMADGDSYRLNERLLKLGMIYQWKAHKGSPYAEDMGSFSDALAMEMGHDKPSPILIGGRPIGPVNIRADVGSVVLPP
jgi:hypothetical protein